MTKYPIQLRAELSDGQAATLQQRLSALPFKFSYEEQQQGDRLVVLIGCTPAQERPVREILQDVGASIVKGT
jgi:hypothetical protein